MSEIDSTLERCFMDVYNECGDLLQSCLPRTKRFWKRVDMLLQEQESILLYLSLKR